MGRVWGFIPHALPRALGNLTRKAMLCQACGQDIIVRRSGLGRAKEVKAKAENHSATPLKFTPEEIVIQCSPGLNKESLCVYPTITCKDYLRLSDYLEYSSSPELYNIAIQLDLFTGAPCLSTLTK